MQRQKQNVLVSFAILSVKLLSVKLVNLFILIYSIGVYSLLTNIKKKLILKSQKSDIS